MGWYKKGEKNITNRAKIALAEWILNKEWAILWAMLGVSLWVSAHFFLWQQSWESSASRNAKYGRISLREREGAASSGSKQWLMRAFTACPNVFAHTCVCECVCVCVCEWVCNMASMTSCTWAWSSSYWNLFTSPRAQWRTPQHAYISVCVCVKNFERHQETPTEPTRGHTGVTLT